MNASFAGGPTFTTLNSFAPGKYNFKTPEVEAPLYEIIYGSAPACDGSYSINFGFRNQGIVLNVVYIAASEAECLSQWTADMAAIVGPSDFTVGGATFKRCFVDAAGSKNGDIEQLITDTGIIYYMNAVIKVSSKGSAQ